MYKYEERNEIDRVVYEDYPGVKSYNLKVISDEIIYMFMKESIDGKLYFHLSDLKEQFDLTNKELNKVMTYLKDDTKNIRKLQIKGIQIEIQLNEHKLNYMTDEFREMIDDEVLKMYDLENKGIKIFNKVWLKNLIFSVDQAKKLLSDIFYQTFCTNDKEEVMKKIRDKQLNKEFSKKQSDLDTKGFRSNSYEQKYIEIIKEKESEIKTEQIKNFVEECYLNFIDCHNIKDKNGWYKPDDIVADVETILNNRDLSYDQKNKIDYTVFQSLEKPTYNLLKKSYELHNEYQILM